jgi:hypothetical protein
MAPNTNNHRPDAKWKVRTLGLLAAILPGSSHLPFLFFALNYSIIHLSHRDWMLSLFGLHLYNRFRQSGQFHHSIHFLPGLPSSNPFQIGHCSFPRVSPACSLQ